MPERFVKQSDDPVADLAELLLVMRMQAAATDDALHRVERNRFNLLIVHAVAAILIGVLLIASKAALIGPAWEYLHRLPLFPYSFGGVLAIGGLVLLPGSLARSARMELVGLGIIYLWYLALAIGFLIPVVTWTWEAAPLFLDGKPLPPKQPTLYAWVVYLHLAVIMRVHIWTLQKIHRLEKAAREAEGPPA